MKYTIAELNHIATKAWYEKDHICFKLSDEKEVRFPIYLNSKFKKANTEQLNNIEIICGGTGLHWPDLDEDLSVIGILEGRYGKM
ncbi:DUF2442 domain-containing protein [Roseimarinus sediminis]|uniref:DUF2442 domain-containing protein n=1 Tax=Roseimarinus sediminis TaxID=1610899 RepID=UPI003D23F68B